MRQITVGGGEGLRERSSSDQGTLVAQALLALAEHLESARACPPIGSATEPLKPAACRSQTPELPRGDDLEEVWHVASKLCEIIFDPPMNWGDVSQRYRDKFYVDTARSLIAELDRYRKGAA